jgi:hypothetical protein
MDGLFQHALHSHLNGNASAAADLDENVQHVPATLLDGT